MVYIYKKTVSGKSYYYLRASAREGERVISKDIAYLGGSIDEAKRSLEKLPGHKSEIRRAYKNIKRFLESNHYLERARSMKLKKDDFLGDELAGVEACKLHYTSIFNRLDQTTQRETLKNFLIEFAFNTTSIEGNTITLKEARNLLEEGRTPKNKTLREIHDLQNTETVFFDLLESDDDVAHELIEEIHSGLMKNIDIRIGYRIQDVRVIRSNFEATPAPYVKTDMDLLLKWYANNQALHPLVLATVFHHKFEKIHPFMDGNGRVGRMLLNYILMSKGYPPLIIHKKSRAEYLDALGRADKGGLSSTKVEEYKPLVQFIAGEMTGHYWGMFL
ncbi:MAG: Fic family protein [Candidatus Altiarchaeota archaeon]|nr:Fic family protein [Candidatus Altiarchaeota archaeon]